MAQNSFVPMIAGLCATVLLAACGGSNPPPPAEQTPAGQAPAGQDGILTGPPPQAEDFPLAPVSTLAHGHTVVGIAPADIVNRTSSPLAAAGSHRGFTLSSGRVRDGAGADEVVAYLKEELADFSKEVTAFPGNPVVRVSRDASDEQYRLVAYAVATLNTVLPRGRRLLMGGLPTFCKGLI